MKIHRLPLLLLSIPFLAGHATAGSGGPDAYGYTWIDSDDGHGPAYQWITPSASATTLLSGNASNSATFTLACPWGGIYGAPVAEMKVSRNGYLTDLLSDSGNDETNDCPLPAAPSVGGGNRLYVVHDNLEIDNTTGTITYEYLPESPHPHDDGGVHVITWNDVHHSAGDTTRFSFQALLFDNLDILYQFAPGNPELGQGSTTGIQNAAATIGMGIVCDEKDLPGNHAILIRPPVLTVTTAADEADTPAGPFLSLREAIRDAVSGTRIEFAPLLEEEVIHLGASEGGQNSRIDIDGKVLAIDASALDAPVPVSGSGDNVRHSFVENGAWASLRNLRLEQGLVSGAGNRAGSMRVIGGSTLLARDCRWLDNTAEADAGALLVDDGSIACLHLCDFQRNRTESTGGAVTVIDGAHFVASKCLFYRNAAGTDGSGNGGALRLGDGDAGLHECEFALNTAPGTGGAILANINSTLTARACTFDQNRANNGGAFTAENSTTAAGTPCVGVFERCTFYQNTARSHGGAIYENSSTNNPTGTADLSFRYCTILENSAGTGGGGFSIGEADIEVAAILLGHNQTFTTEDNIDLRGSGSLDPTPGDNHETGSEGNFQTNFGVSNADITYAPLGYHGGFVRTCMPLADSDGVDASLVADNAFPPGPDARGLPPYRTVTGPGVGTTDVGAVELGPVVNVTSGADAGPGSLRVALTLVESGGIIRFDGVPKVELLNPLGFPADTAIFIDGSLGDRVQIEGFAASISDQEQVAFHRVLFTDFQSLSVTGGADLSSTSVAFSHCTWTKGNGGATCRNAARSSWTRCCFQDLSQSTLWATLATGSGKRPGVMFLRDCDVRGSRYSGTSAPRVLSSVFADTFVQRCSFSGTRFDSLGGQPSSVISTASNNSAATSLFLENVTLSGNSTRSNAVATAVFSSMSGGRVEMDVRHCTFADHRIPQTSAGPAIFAVTGPGAGNVRIRVTNSVFAGNESNDKFGSAQVTSGGGNLFDTDSNFSGSDLTHTDPQLSKLAAGLNGTLHHVPRPGSPCIEGALLIDNGPLDGRGAPRLVDGDFSGLRDPDSGAVESGRVLTVTTATDENDGGLGLGFGDSLRECLAEAASAGGVSVGFHPSLAGDTLTLASQLDTSSATSDIFGGDLGIILEMDIPTDRVFRSEADEAVSVHGLAVESSGGLARVIDDSAFTFNDGDFSGATQTAILAEHQSTVRLDTAHLHDSLVPVSFLEFRDIASLDMVNSAITGLQDDNPGGNGFNPAVNLRESTLGSIRSSTFAHNALLGANIITQGQSCLFMDRLTFARNGGFIEASADTVQCFGASIFSNISVGYAFAGAGEFSSLGDNLSEMDLAKFDESEGDVACRMPYLGPLADYDGDGVPEMPPLAISPVFDQEIGAADPPAEILTVTTATDQNDTPVGAEISLREAIRDIAPGGTVVFDPSLDDTGFEILISAGDLPFDDSLSIDATSLPSGIDIVGGRFVSSSAGLHLALHGIHMRDYTGAGTSGGSARVSTGTLIASHCTFSNNACTSPSSGGAWSLSNSDGVGENCTFSGNSAVGGMSIAMTMSTRPGSLRLRHCTFADHSGSSFSEVISLVGTGANRADLSLSACVFTHNTSGSGTIPSVEFTNNAVLTSLGSNGFPDNPTGTIASDQTNYAALESPTTYNDLADHGGWVETQTPLPLGGMEDWVPGPAAGLVPPPLLDARGYPRLYETPGSSSPGIADWGAIEFGGSLVDTDGDNLPDYWEWFYGFDSKSTDDSAGNPDGDAADNLAEFNGNTDPLVPDVFSDDVEIVAAYLYDDPGTPPGDLVFRIEWIGQPGTTYTFERSNNLQAPWLADKTGIPATGGIDIEDMSYSSALMKEFFRIRSEP